MIALAAPGIEVDVLTRGAILRAIRVPDRHGQMADVTLGFAEPDAYAENPAYFGAVCGRYANRIAGGRFTLDGEEHVLSVNQPPNHLHGGTTGFDQREWAAAPAGERAVRLSYVSPDGEEGYPGRVEVEVTYTVSPGELRLDYRASTDRPTVLNLTNHSYFNLAGEGTGSALDHELELFARAYLPIGPGGIPTGEIAPVAGTPFDFRRPWRINERLREADPQLLAGRGYDHTWVLDGEGLRLAARLRDPASGRTLTVATTEPGVQFYSGNLLDATLVGARGHIYRPGDGLALETQHFPDSPNRPEFPSTMLRPGEGFRSSTVLAFSTDA